MLYATLLYLPSLSNFFKIVTNCLDDMRILFSEAIEYARKPIPTLGFKNKKWLTLFKRRADKNSFQNGEKTMYGV